jgi:hypothetical protein
MQVKTSTRGRFARRAIALTACLLPAAVAVAQDAGEPVWIKPKLEAGQTMRFEFGFDLSLLQKMDGDNENTRDINRRQEGVLALTVDEVGPDGSALVSGKVESVQLMVKDGERELTYSSKDVPAGDDAPAWGGLGKLLTEAEIAFAVTPAGKVESVSGLSEFESAAFEAAQGADLAGLFSRQVFARTVEPIFSVDGAAGNRQIVGRGWQTTESVNLGAVGVMDVTHDFKFVTVQEGSAIMMGIPSVQVRRPTQARPEVAQVSVDDSTGYTRVEYSPDDQVLTLRDQVVRLATTWTLGEPDTEGYVKMEQVQNSKLSIKLIQD